MLAGMRKTVEPYRVVRYDGERAATFYLQDCIAGLGAIKEKSVDVVVTSPPYNIGIGYSSYRDSMPREKYLEWMKQVASGVKRALADDGSFFLNMGNRP